MKSNSDNVPTGEQHKGRQRSDSAEPDSGGIPKSNILHKAMQEWLLEKTIFNVRQKGVPPLLLPASVLQLPRCLVRICNLFHKDNQLRIGKFQKMQLHQKNLLQIQFAP